MGNRAVITFDEYNPNDFGVYVHWNGGRDSIEAFLEATRRVMDGRVDPSYAMARFVQVVGTNFPGNCSVGIGLCKNLDCENWDNGVYVVDSSTLKIIDRKFYDGEEQDEHPVEEFADILVAAIEAGNKVYNSHE
jgi:hypothetical protein